MLTFYKELTRRVHLKSVIWLHDGLWIPKEVPLETIVTAEQSMLQQLQLEQTPLFRIKDLVTETKELIGTMNKECHNLGHGPAIPHQGDRAASAIPQDRGRIRWNTQAPTAGYETFVERTAKRRRTLR